MAVKIPALNMPYTAFAFLDMSYFCFNCQAMVKKHSFLPPGGSETESGGRVLHKMFDLGVHKR